MYKEKPNTNTTREKRCFFVCVFVFTSALTMGGKSHPVCVCVCVCVCATAAAAERKKKRPKEKLRLNKKKKKRGNKQWMVSGRTEVIYL